MKMNKAERQAYDRHIDNIMVQNDVLDTAKLEGIEEGHAEGRAEKKTLIGQGDESRRTTASDHCQDFRFIGNYSVL